MEQIAAAATAVLYYCIYLLNSEILREQDPARSWQSDDDHHR